MKNTAPVAIKVDGITKNYLLHQTPWDRLRELLGFKRPKHVKEYPALDGISLEIKKGETVGILGINGAGKSTLLQIITGVLQPTSGGVITTGRISALLELGAGFNPLWSGRKNAEFQYFLQGGKQVNFEAHLEKVKEFADIGIYFEEPVRTYSSGMYMRVAFASAVINTPDILIVDEALAVGDVKFQNKCFRRFQELQEQGCTVLFVTHGTDLINQFCTRGIIINQGKVYADGLPADITKSYMILTTSSLGSDNPTVADFSTEISHTVENKSENVEYTPKKLEYRFNFNSQELRSGSGGARIADALLHRGDFEEVLGTVSPGEQLHLSLRINVNKVIKSPEVGVILRSSSNQILSGASDWAIADRLAELAVCTDLMQHWIFTANFLAGDYFIDIGIADLAGGERVVHDLRQSVLRFDVSTVKQVFGIVDVNFSLDHKV